MGKSQLGTKSRKKSIAGQSVVSSAMGSKFNSRNSIIKKINKNIPISDIKFNTMVEEAKQRITSNQQDEKKLLS